MYVIITCDLAVAAFGETVAVPRILAMGKTPQDLWGRLANYCDGVPAENAYEALCLACEQARAGEYHRSVVNAPPSMVVDEEGTEVFVEYWPYAL